jgi:hypothetical protein
LVGFGLLLAALAATSPFNVECPDSVRVGQTFSLTVRCVSSACTGISSGSPVTGPGLQFVGSATSGSIATVNTPTGTTRQNQFTLELMFMAVSPGEWTLGPVEIDAQGAGRLTVPRRTVVVTGGGASSSGSSQPQQSSRGHSWITPEIRNDTRGRVYPGIPITIDYYLYSSYNVTDISYAWSGAERGVITVTEEIPSIEWQHSRISGVNRAKFFTAVFVPACAGVLDIPRVSAQVTYGNRLLYAAPKDYLVSDSLTVDVFPFPEPVPEGWDGILLDSVRVSFERLGYAVGQAGERSVRLMATGPGAPYCTDAPSFTVHGNATLLESASGCDDNGAWWDFIVEPSDTGTVVFGPDTLIWLDRKHACYRTSVMEPCSIDIRTMPRQNREIEIPDRRSKGLPATTWVILSLGVLVVISTALILHSGRRKKGNGSVGSAENPEELLNRFECELSKLLTGGREYLGCEELADRLDDREIDTLLSRSIQRLWKDLEQAISGREPGREAFLALRERAVQLIGELARETGKT